MEKRVIKAIIRLDGHTYIPKTNEELPPEEVALELARMANRADSLRTELESGEWLVLGREALKRAHFLVREVPA